MRRPALRRTGESRTRRSACRSATEGNEAMFCEEGFFVTG